jgi:hypothetical protein
MQSSLLVEDKSKDYGPKTNFLFPWSINRLLLLTIKSGSTDLAGKNYQNISIFTMLLNEKVMQIYSGIITLDYNPATDVLISEMPDTREFGLSEVSFCLELIVENVRNYDIKHLLLDSSKSVLGLEGEAYKSLSIKFSRDLMSTRLKKIARVGTTNSNREEKSAKLTTELRQELNFPIQFQNFTNQAEALQWLHSPTV